MTNADNRFVDRNTLAKKAIIRRSFRAEVYGKIEERINRLNHKVVGQAKKERLWTVDGQQAELGEQLTR